jgi:hypothetical protein
LKNTRANENLNPNNLKYTCTVYESEIGSKPKLTNQKYTCMYHIRIRN